MTPAITNRKGYVERMLREIEVRTAQIEDHVEFGAYSHDRDELLLSLSDAVSLLLQEELGE